MRVSQWCCGKESACQCRTHKFDPWVGKTPWRRAWQPTPVLLSGKSHGQRSLAGYSPWGHKELDTTEQLSAQPLWRTGWRFLNKLKIELPYDPAAPLLDIHLEKNMIRKDTCTSVFTEAHSYNNQDMEAT